MKYQSFSLLILFLSLIFSACSPDSGSKDSVYLPKNPPLFKLLNSEQTGITFSNPLEENLNLNVLMYEYLYNGGGVAIGDLNQDGLDDIYFSSNIGENQLYLNLGNLQFKEISKISGAGGRPGPWKTGVVFADVNGDGLLDIYLCRSGALMPEKRKNELFINLGNDSNGIPQFKEMAEEYGIDSQNTSTSAAFFDFDRDGDLDLFLLNHNIRSIQNQDPALTQKLLLEKHESGSQLFENLGGKFVEITQKAGISSSSLSYGLGVNVSDINNDGWPDIYIGNDYTMPDYLYINQKNGTFKDQIQEMLDHVSHFSMGNDIADINNDGLLDIFTLDMLPEDNYRQKLLLSPDNFEMYQLNLDRGFYHQTMRNMLHLNAGDGTFLEVGQLAGISNTDWSWSALFADFDLDGWKDLFVTNGYLRDYNNQDFLKYMDNYVQTKGGQLKREDLLALVKSMSSSNLKNYAFKNTGGFQFKNTSDEWGLAELANSNGAAYADLDLDGDLDLVINNLNYPAMVYENQAIQHNSGNFLKIQLNGKGGNTFGFGAKVKIFYQGKEQVQELTPFRGFQSSVAPYLIFGIGNSVSVDSIHIHWPSGSFEKIGNTSTNTTLKLKEGDLEKIKYIQQVNPLPMYSLALSVPQTKNSTQVNDFKRQPLLNFGISGNGKPLAKADFDGDGLQDLFIGGAAGLSGQLLFGIESGRISKVDSLDFIPAKNSEDAVALPFDANGDGYLDLFVGSGGIYNWNLGDQELKDRLYLNDGMGNFVENSNALPVEYFPTGTALAGDFNGDGNQDLLVGARINPGQFPTSPGARIWVGNGKGNFSDETEKIFPKLKSIGMLTDSDWIDLDRNGENELILVGDAMPITVCSKRNGKWEIVTEEYFEVPQVGFWNDLEIADWDKDGTPELIVGNHGLNSQLYASTDQPIEILYHDFDGNGSTDVILGYFVQGQKYPSPSRDEVLGQVNFLKKRYLDFKSFAEVKMEDLFSSEEREGAHSIFINRLETSYYKLGDKGKFEIRTLPIEVQFSPAFTIESMDLNRDGHLDMIIGGNLLDTKLKFGKLDASHGLVLLGNGSGTFQVLSSSTSGISQKGEIRGIVSFGNYLAIYVKGKGLYVYRDHLSKEKPVMP